MPKPVIVPPFDGTPEDLARALLRDKTTGPEAGPAARLKEAAPLTRRPSHCGTATASTFCRHSTRKAST